MTSFYSLLSEKRPFEGVFFAFLCGRDMQELWL